MNNSLIRIVVNYISIISFINVTVVTALVCGPLGDYDGVFSVSINLPPGVLRNERIIVEEGLDVVKEIESGRLAEDIREMNCDYATLCAKCWVDIRKSSTILNNVF